MIKTTRQILYTYFVYILLPTRMFNTSPHRYNQTFNILHVYQYKSLKNTYTGYTQYTSM